MAINNSKLVKNHIIVNVIIATMYVCFYDFIYKAYVCTLFRETYIPLSSAQYGELILFGIIPIFFYKGLSNIASIFSLFTYILAYIPFNETLAVGGWRQDFLDYRIVFFLSMCIFFLTDSITIGDHFFCKKPNVKFSTFRKVSYFFLVFVVLLNVSNLHLTNFMQNRADLYDLRANLKVVGGTPVVYLIYWFKNVILPILLVSSLIRKEILHFFFAFLGCICMFMIDQQKITFFAPFAIVLLFCIYKRNPSFVRNSFHNMIMAILIVAPYLCYTFKDVSDAAYELAAILIYRTQCIEGQELNTYLNFFGHDGLHAYTYFSHIGIVNFFTNGYPYGNVALGNVVTGGGSNANGMFWLMDGVAAGGIYACAFISCVFVFVKSLFNGIKKRCSPEMFAIISLFAMSMTMNVSLFTALLSCGLLLLYVLFICVDFHFFKNIN